MDTYLITGLISVIDPFFRHHFWGKKVSKFAKVDPISQSLLQFCGKGQVLLQAGFYPPENTQILTSEQAQDSYKDLFTFSSCNHDVNLTRQMVCYTEPF